MSSFLMLLYVFTVIIVTYSQNYIYNGDYQLSHPDWEATCLFYYDQHLASIHNESQRVEAQNTAGDIAWIGLSDSAAWGWTDNTPFIYGFTGSQSPWAANAPNNAGECAQILADGTWSDADCVTAEYGLCGHPKPFTVVNDKPSNVRIRGQADLIGYIDILDEIYIDFYITFTSWPTGLGSILHFGNNDAERYPAIFIDGATLNIVSSFATVATADPAQSTTTSGYTLNTEYHYTLHKTQRQLTITFGGDYSYDEPVTVSHPIVMNRAIYLGSGWHDSFGAEIRNLVVTNGNSPETRFWNYVCDWDDRWSQPDGGSWGYGSTGGDCSIRQSSSSILTHTWMGTNDPTSLAWTDYTIEFLILILSGNSVGPIFRANNAECTANFCGQYYEVLFRSDMIEFIKFDDSYTSLYEHAITHSPGVQYLLRVECVADTFKVYEDNVYLFTWIDASYAAGSVGFRTYNTDARISKVRITFPQDQQWHTINPSVSPTTHPSVNVDPSVSPTNDPTSTPSTKPTLHPSLSPITTTKQPTFSPTTTAAPTFRPTKATTPPTTSPITADASISSPPSAAPSSPRKQSDSVADTQVLDDMTLILILLTIILICCIIFVLFLVRRNFCIAAEGEGDTDINDKQTGTVNIELAAGTGMDSDDYLHRVTSFSSHSENGDGDGDEDANGNGNAADGAVEVDGDMDLAEIANSMTNGDNANAMANVMPMQMQMPMPVPNYNLYGMGGMGGMGMNDMMGMNQMMNEMNMQMMQENFGIDNNMAQFYMNQMDIEEYRNKYMIPVILKNQMVTSETAEPGAGAGADAAGQGVPGQDEPQPQFQANNQMGNVHNNPQYFNQ